MTRLRFEDSYYVFEMYTSTAVNRARCVQSMGQPVSLCVVRMKMLKGRLRARSFAAMLITTSAWYNLLQRCISWAHHEHEIVNISDMIACIQPPDWTSSSGETRRSDKWWFMFVIVAFVKNKYANSNKTVLWADLKSKLTSLWRCDKAGRCWLRDKHTHIQHSL